MVLTKYVIQYYNKIMLNSCPPLCSIPYLYIYKITDLFYNTIY